MRRLFSAFLVVLAILGASGAAASARAAITTKKAMWGPATVDGVSQFPVYADLGVGVWETAIHWDSVAPTRPADASLPSDPAYRWPAELDAALADAASHGIAVSVLVIGAPGWANGGHDWRWVPRARDFATFVAAAARRYPSVHRWMVWGEPTKASNFQPIEPDRLRPLRGGNLRTARRYAQMLDAAYVALKAVSRRNLVIGGNTYTIGDIAPRNWIRALRLRGGRRPRMDLYGHNPFSLREPGFGGPALGAGRADFNDLPLLARWLDRAFPRRHLRLFLSEYSLPTDHENYEFNFYVTRAIQADWLTKALRITRRWPRIATFGYLGLYDDPLRSRGDQVERGLLQRDGARKPSYPAYRAA